MIPTVVLAFTGALLCVGLAVLMLYRDARSFVAQTFAGLVVQVDVALFHLRAGQTRRVHREAVVL